MLYSIVLTVHILVGFSIIGLVLIQHGKGADMGAAFGGGASGSLFGASGSANFLSRTTGFLAAAFFLTSLTLTYLGNSRSNTSASVIDQVSSVPNGQPTVATSAPAPATTSKVGEIPK